MSLLADAQVSTHKPAPTEAHTDPHALKLEAITIHFVVSLPKAHVSQAVRLHKLPEKEGEKKNQRLSLTVPIK